MCWQECAGFGCPQQQSSHCKLILFHVRCMQQSHYLAECTSAPERWPNWPDPFFFFFPCTKEGPGEFAKVNVSLWRFLGKHPDIPFFPSNFTLYYPLDFYSIFRRREVSVGEVRFLEQQSGFLAGHARNMTCLPSRLQGPHSPPWPAFSSSGAFSSFPSPGLSADMPGELCLSYSSP